MTVTGGLGQKSLLFGLPPSLGSDRAKDRVRLFAGHLAQQLGCRVELVVAAHYQALAASLKAGEVDMVWAPPLVCARLETGGLRVALRGVRDGASTYRAALVCRRSSPLTFDTLQGTRAAWVDPDSVGGHLLAVVMLKSKGLVPAKLFSEQKFAGSYRDALLAVDRAEAEVASVFAPPGPASSKATRIADVLPERAGSFAVVGFSSETPNDGVVMSKRLGPGASASITRVLLSMHTTTAGAALLARAFSIERFEAAPPDGYRSLYKVEVGAW